MVLRSYSVSLRIVMIAVVASSVLLVLPLGSAMASTGGQSSPSREDKALEAQDWRGQNGPHKTERDCLVVNGEFQRYYRTGPCFHLNFPNYPQHTGWYFAYYDK
jgi:hypothetical protein